MVVLKGGAIFAADLIRELTIPFTIEFIAASSYRDSTSSSGEVTLSDAGALAIGGRDVLVVEDILDTGLTLCFLRSLFEQHKPATLRIAALLDKPSRRLEKIEADYVGFKIPNHFVIGYGMDYAERYRNLRGVYRLNLDEA